MKLLNVGEMWTELKFRCRDFYDDHENTCTITLLVGAALLLASLAFFGCWICSPLNASKSGIVLAFPCALLLTIPIYYAGATRHKNYSMPGDDFGFGAGAAMCIDFMVGAVFLVVTFFAAISMLLGMLIYCLTMQGWFYFWVLSGIWTICVPFEGIILFNAYAWSVIWMRKLRKKPRAT